MGRYYVKGLPWAHGLGTPMNGERNVEEVLKKAKLDFYVDKCQLVAKMPFTINQSPLLGDPDAFSYGGNIYRDCPNAYATYRTDMNIPLGLVKSKYEVVQNRDAFDFFDEAIGPGKAEYQYAGAYGYGHKVFITAKLPNETFVKGEPLEHYLVLSNSHDGSSSINIMFTPIRVFCTNCLNFGMKQADSYIRIKHTKTAKERLDNGARILKIACQYATEATEIYKSLSMVSMGDDAVLKYICGLILTPDEVIKLYEYDKVNGFRKLAAVNYLTLEATGISTRKANQIATIYDYYFTGVAQKDIVGSAWGAYNAITGYYSNVANLDGERRMDSLLYGNANNVTHRALIEAREFAEAV